MIHGMSDEGGRMKTGHMTHLAMLVNGSPLGLWVPHSVQEAQAFNVPYSDTPLSAVSESSFLGHGSSQCCFCQGTSETGNVSCPSAHRALTDLWNRHSRGWVPAECLEQKMLYAYTTVCTQGDFTLSRK